ncbi:hypothetical protein QYE76_054742 [Lolium multiflorum]|uniref:Uncharacterized protein n=1 Tax=Lolium multiflorum TaxID=4521 RepID=A0AAD8SYA6_LOLMU|nr:hypothetical protein QYE76_054742 [Lolium multiflorum]
MEEEEEERGLTGLQLWEVVAGSRQRQHLRASDQKLVNRAIHASGELLTPASAVIVCHRGTVSLLVLVLKEVDEVGRGVFLEKELALAVAVEGYDKDLVEADEVASKKTPEPDLGALLPEDFLGRTKRMGLVIKSWVPQHDVLAHDAIGGFITHRGWTSILESVMVGVPLLAWPLYAEQRINKMFLEKELGLTMAVEGYDKDVVEADQVASNVSWIVDSEGGRLLRERTLAAKRQVKGEMRHGGESDLTLARLVDGWMLA